MIYEKQTWVDTPAGGTPLEDSRLNHMEDGIEEGASAHAPLAYAGAHTVTAADFRRVMEIGSATPVNLTVPLNATEALPIGFVTEVCQVGAGTVTIVAEAGVTVRNIGAVQGQWASVGLRKRAINEWVATGELA